MVLRSNRDIVNFDDYNSEGLTSVMSAWLERLFGDDWTLNPDVFDYVIQFRPNQYVKGQLAESWEFSDPNTFVVHLRQGVHWQDIPPVNGREFTADDVVYHYDRILGLGDGFTQAAPYFASFTAYQDLVSVTATNTYTIAFKWKIHNPEIIMENLEAQGGTGASMEAREAVQQWGNLNDWHNAIGTGPFILQDFVAGSSATLVKNPNYWGYDERYPQNRLPYVNSLKFLIILDDSTAMAGLRSGKIDAMDGVSLQNAQSTKQTNPEILQIGTPVAQASTVTPRVDKPPFTDIKVREAMQMAIDLPTLANTYYGGSADPYPSSITSNKMTGWGFPYDQWPQDLKDQYAFNVPQAKVLLTAAGYPDGFKTNVVASADMDMTLLQIVQSSFAAVNIEMDIRTMDSVSWVAFVMSNHKNDQLACRSNGQLGKCTQPINHLAQFQAGYIADVGMVNDPVFNAFYTDALAAASVDEVKQILVDANKYVAQQHFAVCLLVPKNFALYQPWFKGFNAQSYSISGGVSNTGAQLLFFYPARFWIDQNLKMSMGR